MRISDWSSDVCSSDLTLAPRSGSAPPQANATWRRGGFVTESAPSHARPEPPCARPCPPSPCSPSPSPPATRTRHPRPPPPDRRRPRPPRPHPPPTPPPPPCRQYGSTAARKTVVEGHAC